MLEILMGIGLASSAGLNAYIPLLLLGVLASKTHLITLPAPWNTLENPWVIGALVILLIIEMVVDKVPVVDHINDVVQTLVRPTAGGVAFGAASTATTASVVPSSSGLFAGHSWAPIAAGVVISFVIHAMKAAARPVVNVTTAGAGAPVASVIEDIISVAMSIVAILAPIFIIMALLFLVWLFVLMRRRRRRKRLLAAQQQQPIRAG